MNSVSKEWVVYHGISLALAVRICTPGVEVGCHPICKAVDFEAIIVDSQCSSHTMFVHPYYYRIYYWLVVWNMNFIFPFRWECHHPN